MSWSFSELLPAYVGLVIIFVGIGFLIRLSRHASNVFGTVHDEDKTHEEQLARKVKELTGTVATLLTNLSNAQEEIENLRQQLVQANSRITELETIVRMAQGGSGSKLLLVGIGTDPMLKVDLASLRGVESRGLLRIIRLLPVTSDNMKRLVSTYREQGKPIRWVHLATHAGPKGVDFADGVCDGMTLSGWLNEVQVILLGGCETFQTGEMLSTIPFVVTTLEPLDNEDAMRLAGVFWQAVGEGLPPSQVEDRCRKRLPSELMEMAYFRY